jgi:hypothetical protein
MSEDLRTRLQARIAELKAHIGKGGLRECVIRGLLYAGMVRGMVDERSLEALRRARTSDAGPPLTISQFKMLVREQFFMLLLDTESTLEAIPKLLPKSPEQRRAGLAVIRDVLSASAEVSGEVAKRLERVTKLFGVTTERNTDGDATSFDAKAKAS